MTKAYICRLSNEEKEFAAANLNEKDEERSAKIQEIREWILERKDICARTDDFTILRFLRACKFNIDKTKIKMENYYSQRATLPEWFDNRNPFLPEIQELLDLGVFIPLRKFDDDGKMIVIIRSGAYDPHKYQMGDIFKACMMILDLAVRDCEPVTLHGIVAILNLEGVSFAHALQLTPAVIKNLVHAWQGCYPLRIQSLDFVNAPIYVNVVLRIFKMFMNNKLKQRMHVHGDGMAVVKRNVPKHILPEEYGGTDGTIKDLIDHWKKIVEENRDWLKEDEKYKVTLP